MQKNIELMPGEKENLPDESWLHGKYPAIKSEIDTKLPCVAIGGYFWYGDEAAQVINEIHSIWVMGGNISCEDAISRYAINL